MRASPILFRPLFCVCAFLCAGLGGMWAETAMPIATALAQRSLTVEASGNGRDQLTLVLRNASPQPATVSLPAGLIAASATGADRVIVLRAASAQVAAHGETEVAMPVAALSSKNASGPRPFRITDTTEPRLAPLLRALKDQPDAPRPTVQLAVCSVLEDLTFAQWRTFCGTADQPQPTPAEITQAVDALGLLRLVLPDSTFKLTADSELKRLALRNPWSRAKAMAVYGIDLGDGAVAPDLRQLLHTSPGDNCPICRQRALMQGPSNAP